MVDAATRELILTEDQLKKVCSVLLREFNLGLGKETHETATIKMFPTFVRDVPNGREEGKFLALDLGGTNFRVLIIDLKGDKFQMENEIYAIPEAIMLGPGYQLFDHIAECLANFMEKHNLKHYKLPLGFTFSFACRQYGLTKAKLVQWTKGFKCPDVEGHDVVELLQEAIHRRNDIEIDVTAIINDTTGCLMSCAHKNRQCRVGIIIGTGTNACYMEKLENVGTWNEEITDPKKVLINTEWGAFGSNGVLDFLLTEWDEEVDRNSLNPGRQIFEKMISGMYMGEIVRCVLTSLTKKGLLFGGVGSERLFTPRTFGTKYVSWIESDGPGDYTQMKKVLTEKMEIHHATEEDMKNVRLVCKRVSQRAAYLVSAGIATILNKIKRPHTTVGVDGSVYRFHPFFHELMVKKTSELTHPDYHFDLMLSEDGSGRGAALVAAVAVWQKLHKEEMESERCS